MISLSFRSRVMALAGALLLTANPVLPQTSGYKQTNLVSDIPGMAAVTDSDLVNPWGVSFSVAGPFWLSDNGTGKSTLYDGTTGVKQPLIVTVPPPANNPTAISTPTGQVFNNFAPDFAITTPTGTTPSVFIFATEDGTISAWNNTAGTVAVVVVDGTDNGAIYKGLAIGSNATGNFLYAANFAGAKIDVFDQNFSPTTLSGSFTDPGIPTGYVPFNIQNLGGLLYVAYARADDQRQDELACRGCGFVSVFDTDGNFIKRLASRGPLNAPWGLALAPASFGRFANALLVGNKGNGQIDAFNPETGEFLGRLRDSTGKLIAISGLWALSFGNDGTAGSSQTLFFTAGINNEQNGLFGSLVPAQ